MRKRLHTALEVLHDLAQQLRAVDRKTTTLLQPHTSSSISAGESWRTIPSRSHSSHTWQELVSESLPRSTTSAVLHLHLRTFMRTKTMLDNMLGSLGARLPLTPHRTRGSIEQLLRDTIWLYEDMAADKGIELRLTSHTCPDIAADWMMLQRAFANLLDNAIKYSYATSPGTQQRFVEISTRRHTIEGAVRVIVSSYGVGILPEELSSNRLFTYGYRGILAQRESRSGTGIGLAETKRILDAHNAVIDVKSSRVADNADIFLTSFVIDFCPLFSRGN